jgi:hypothetical protein
LSDCPDTSKICIEDLNFTSEFKKNYDSLGCGIVTAQKIKIKELIFDFIKPEIIINHGDSVLESIISLNIPKQNNTDDIKFKYNLIDTIKLAESYIVGSNGSFLEINSDSNIVRINKFRTIDSNITVYSKFKISDINLIKDRFLKIIDVIKDECSCVQGFSSDSLRITVNDTTDISEIILNECTLNQSNSILTLTNLSDIQRIVIYDYLGRILNQIDVDDRDVIEINMFKYNAGLYFVALFNKNKIEIKNIYKNYSN